MKRAALKRTWACFAILAGHMSGAGAQIDSGTAADVDITADGLHRVDPSIMPGAWAKPELDLTPYTKVVPWRAAMSFRPTADRGRRGRRRAQDAYPIDEDAQLQIRTLFADAFQENLADLERYELWDGPGRDVLMVEGYLLDVISHIPLEQAITDDIAADITWEATLVVQIRDSMSDEVLARAAERYRERGGFGTSASNWIHMQRVIRRWSEILCGRLDELAAFGAVR